MDFIFILLALVIMFLIFELGTFVTKKVITIIFDIIETPYNDDYKNEFY